jgi:hypothetical protein
MSYARIDGESIGVYSKILKNCLHNGSIHYTFLY